MMITDSKIPSTHVFKDETMLAQPPRLCSSTNIQTGKTMGSGATCSQNRIGSESFGESYRKKERRNDPTLVYQYAAPRLEDFSRIFFPF